MEVDEPLLRPLSAARGREAGRRDAECDAATEWAASGAGHLPARSVAKGRTPAPPPLSAGSSAEERRGAWSTTVRSTVGRAACIWAVTSEGGRARALGLSAIEWSALSISAGE